jgi:hypothetical protein
MSFFDSLLERIRALFETTRAPEMATSDRLGYQLFCGEEFFQHKLAFDRSFVRIMDRRPDATIPNDHRAATVFSFGNDTLKIEIFERVILGANGQALVGRQVARSVGACPAQKNPIELEPKIKMKTSRVMLLDNELVARVLCSARPRLAGSRKISLRAIGLEPVGDFGRHLKRTGADFERILARTVGFANTAHRAPCKIESGHAERSPQRC